MIWLFFTRNWKDIEKDLFNDEDIETLTSVEQINVESNIKRLYQSLGSRCRVDNSLPKLITAEHEKYLRQCLTYLPAGYVNLDASRTWMCYWIVHSLSLLEVELPEQQLNNIVDFIGKCQCPTGGFGGGPGQLPHLATTYAAVNISLLCNRVGLQSFLWSLRSPEGAFCMHRDGEVDIRGTYCALAVATLTNIATNKLFKVLRNGFCQTYEGGFSGCPGMEAHGGYTFCGLASLFLLNRIRLCDVKSLLRWLVNRQMKYEGGFQGRTNKLVDGCYSFWQAASFPLLHKFLTEQDGCEPEDVLFNRAALQEYILICCQHYDGGLLDKPGKPRDTYHTCYTISGLSIAQHSLNGKLYILGTQNNKVAETNPIFNIKPHLAMKAVSYFSGQGFSKTIAVRWRKPKNRRDIDTKIFVF
ncbi:geranylgeranyl transferase type beta subunit [Holotrichia oblita]|uniref:Geranylgeranyl transferase type beta subunit n=1 Tax=Holotrichia oblita TaxID=644536 RepID=A0ACB9TQD3_HOLOL|nr:geranylgeranyl transferase type beta subunit [Holotrichia oblita]